MQTRSRVKPRSDFKLEASSSEIKDDLKKLTPKTNPPRTKAAEASPTVPHISDSHLEQEALEGLSLLLSKIPPKGAVFSPRSAKPLAPSSQYPVCFPYPFFMLQNVYFPQASLMNGSVRSQRKNSALHQAIGYKISQLKQSYLSYHMY